MMAAMTRNGTNMAKMTWLANSVYVEVAGWVGGVRRKLLVTR